MLVSFNCFLRALLLKKFPPKTANCIFPDFIFHISHPSSRQPRPSFLFVRVMEGMPIPLKARMCSFCSLCFSKRHCLKCCVLLSNSVELHFGCFKLYHLRSAPLVIHTNGRNHSLKLTPIILFGSDHSYVKIEAQTGHKRLPFSI